MSGYVFCAGQCISCGRTFSFNPVRVPSVRINGNREPVCESCIIRANPLRIKRGLEPVEILPGAYEPVPEHEL